MSSTALCIIRVLLVGDETRVQEAVTRVIDGEENSGLISEASSHSEMGDLSHQVGADVVVLVLDSNLAHDRDALRHILHTLPDARILCLVPDNTRLPKSLIDAGVGGIILRSAPSHELVTGIRVIARGGTYMRLPEHSGSEHEALWWGDVPTSREMEVLQLVAEGWSNRTIAERLSISQRTVQFHLSRIFVKLGATSRTHAVHLARQRGLIR